MDGRMDGLPLNGRRGEANAIAPLLITRRRLLEDSTGHMFGAGAHDRIPSHDNGFQLPRDFRIQITSSKCFGRVPLLLALAALPKSSLVFRSVSSSNNCPGSRVHADERAARILYLNTGIGGEPKFEMGGFGLEKQLREVRGSVEQHGNNRKDAIFRACARPAYLIGFYSFFLYYYVTTVAMEVKFMWPRKWHWGKVLFLVNRYLPMVVYSANFLTVWRVYIILSPKLSTESTVIQRRALTLAANLIQIGNLAETSRNYLEALPLSEFDRELGYACTWAGSISAANAKKGIFALALFIFMVRYRKQTGTFKLFHVLRRDSGVYILLLAVIRLGSAIAGAFQLKLGWYSIPDEVLSALNGAVVPILANRLLLNMWKTQDPDVRKSVSSILFDPPRPGEDSDDDDEEFADRPIEMVRYKGLGRRRAAAREANEGTLQGGAGATQAAENGEDVSGYGTTRSWAHSFANICHSLF
ncbi:hypothetical protein DFP72DRAFT_1045381 [Ephemerocybe angulata]|uniref:DUF6533 domain-containing protein n=1 Tax=Ephemerocybe angulata TaxID=980116 RepID=A0A8H6I044_9AGAR|nr:hypothetical protein DFP72DRAFT_1045381 [Tulosesus angulatus]